MPNRTLHRWGAVLSAVAVISLLSSCREAETIDIELILPDHFAGFFELTPDPKFAQKPLAGKTFDIVVEGPTTPTEYFEAFTRWHRLDARRASGEKLNVVGKPTNPNEPMTLYVLYGNSASQTFLLGDSASKKWFYSRYFDGDIEALRRQHAEAIESHFVGQPNNK